MLKRAWKARFQGLAASSTALIAAPVSMRMLRLLPVEVCRWKQLFRCDGAPRRASEYHEVLLRKGSKTLTFPRKQGGNGRKSMENHENP